MFHMLTHEWGRAIVEVTGIMEGGGGVHNIIQVAFTLKLHNIFLPVIPNWNFYLHSS